MTYDYIRDMRVVGILSENRERGLMEIGVPVGVVAALIPSTNPTSTVMYKCLIAIKAGNSIVISPHPSAKKLHTGNGAHCAGSGQACGAPEGRSAVSS